MNTVMKGVDLVVLGIGAFSLIAGVAAILIMLVAPLVAVL